MAGISKGINMVLVALGVLLILAGLGIVGYNMWDSARAGDASNAIAQDLEDATVDGYISDGSGQAMPVVEVDGKEYLGMIQIPSLDISLPVLANWDYAGLEISPCRYSGNYYNNDMVVCAHNYASHFGPLDNIGIGVDVYFTNVKGEQFHYIVGNREELSPTSVEEMTLNKNNSDEGFAGDWDLTLFTCTLDGNARVSVRCLLSD